MKISSLVPQESRPSSLLGRRRGTHVSLVGLTVMLLSISQMCVLMNQHAGHALTRLMGQAPSSQAVAALENYLSHRPTDLGVHQELVRLYAQLGDRFMAHYHLMEARNLLKEGYWTAPTGTEWGDNIEG